MKSNLKNICIIIERNAKIEKIVYDDYLKINAKAKKDFLENQIINWSYFDSNNENEEIFFKVYVQRYFNLKDVIKQSLMYETDDLSALLVIKINDEDKNDIRGFIEISYHDDMESLSVEMMKVQHYTFMRYIEKIRFMSTASIA